MRLLALCAALALCYAECTSSDPGSTPVQVCAHAVSLCSGNLGYDRVPCADISLPQTQGRSSGIRPPSTPFRSRSLQPCPESTTGTSRGSLQPWRSTSPDHGGHGRKGGAIERLPSPAPSGLMYQRAKQRVRDVALLLTSDTADKFHEHVSPEHSEEVAEKDDEANMAKEHVVKNKELVASHEGATQREQAMQAKEEGEKEQRITLTLMAVESENALPPEEHLIMTASVAPNALVDELMRLVREQRASKQKARGADLCVCNSFRALFKFLLHPVP
jgi:hypothetical protein